MTPREIPKAYNAKDWEDKLYSDWEKSGFFNPDECVRQGYTQPDALPFSIVLPPPNVTGTLHAGHASMLAIEDAFVRFKRMQGYRTLWLPGTDHAAIATQSKVEKIIHEEEGLTRYDLGREEFLKRVEQFAQASHDTIVNQCKKMGSSLDWSREAFTLDEARNSAVRAAFKQMYEDGIIYRGDRIVNWDPKMQTTVSDDEIEWKEEKIPFYYLQYGPFTISTARPETKFGDKYVVMHPEDERYRDYAHGQTIELEWINGPITATVIKDEAIDREFGTGVMTITPWHDHTDFDIAKRHDLDKEQIIDEQGKLLPIAGEFAGLPIAEARTKIIEKLQTKGLVVKIEENYSHNIATNSRGGGVIEPQIKRQWFIDVNKSFERDGKTTTLKTLMQQAVRSGDIEILPERFEKTYFHWIDNLRDWCISRQIWYGHRIPVWYCLDCGKEYVDAEVRSKLFLARHGQTDWNKERRMQGSGDMPLNDTGREQAHRAAESLKHENIGAIFSSDLIRAHETAQIIEEALPERQDIILDQRLRERHMGEAEGMLIDEALKQYPSLSRYEDKPVDNESYKEVEERMWEAVSEYLTNHPGKNVLVVSHGAAIRTLLRRIKNVDPESIMTIGRVPNATPIAIDILDPCTQCGGHFFEQDSDTLDTWFSSGLWTFSTLDWSSDETKWQQEKIYHPTALLETGYDILFFWVARMILMSTYLLGEVPFKTVYLHGLVRDEQGRKMSKSLGNIIDPLDVIAEYGADALRLALVVGSTPGNDLKLSDEKIVASRNFVNKLWNIGRYVANNKDQVTGDQDTDKEKSLADKWILARLNETVAEVTRHLERYQLSLAAETLRDFTWNEFADWYVEIHKIEKNDAVLRQVFGTLLGLWHPLMPFATEAIFQTLHSDAKTFLMMTPWPTSSVNDADDQAVGGFTELQSLITSIRTIRSFYRIDPKEPLTVTLVTDQDSFDDTKDLIRKLARVSDLVISASSETPKHSARVAGTTYTAFVHLEGVIDIEKEKERLSKEQDTLKKYQTGIEARLSDEKFTGKAPAHIIEQNRESLEDTKRKLEELKGALANLLS